MLVAVTRAKKRIYLINTINSKVSGFADCIELKDLSIEEIQYIYDMSQKPTEQEMYFLNQAYNYFYDVHEEVTAKGFWQQDPYYPILPTL